MLVTNSYRVDLAAGTGSRLIPPMPIRIIQGDTDTHAVALNLFEEGIVWNVPDGAVALVGFSRPDGTGGTYDTLPDGTPACTIRHNVVTAVIAAPLLALPGTVQMTVYLLRGEQKLHIFRGVLDIHRDPAADTVPPEDYVNLQQWVASMAPVLVQEPGVSEKAVMSQRAVTDAIAKAVQQGPEFVNDISECTDPAKLYVLPDGFLYAYMTDETAAGGRSWQSTGRAYQAADYEDRIIQLEDDTDDLFSELDALTKQVNSITSGDSTALLPAYWQQTLASKASTIIARHCSSGHDCFSFPVITDLHVGDHLGVSCGLLLQTLLDRCDMSRALCLGDVVAGRTDGTSEAMDEAFATAEAILAPIRPRLLQTQGEQDGAWTAGCHFTPQKLHTLIYRKVGLTGDIHFDADGCGYYTDDTANKVRWIILNAHHNPYEEQEDGTAKYDNQAYFRFGQSQYDLVVEALTTVPGGDWVVLSASHVPLNNDYAQQFGGDQGDHVLMRRLLAAYKNKTVFSGSFAGTYGADAAVVEADFTAAKGRYIAHFAGHSHKDSTGTFDGIRVITTRSDSSNGAGDQTAGTVTEHTFDIFTINKSTGFIHAVRIGAGNSRMMGS